MHGRGASLNPANRFERIELIADPELDPAERPDPKTLFLRDASRTVLSSNESPDVPFDRSLNPYRGCEHGCAYCYARPTHEYLGFSAGLDFETRILVKEDAPDLLRRELAQPGYRPQPIALSGVTDPYQPAERRLELTRRCLEVLLDFRNPVLLITKNHLVTRDLDLLAELSRFQACRVTLSMTSLDLELSRKLEPRASQPRRRLAAIEKLAEAGVPVGVMAAPMIPGLNDHELSAILSSARQSGARFAGYIPLRLPHGVSELFSAWLAEHYPHRREKVLNRVRSMRGGKLNDPNFGSRFRGQGPFADQMLRLFEIARDRNGFEPAEELSVAAFRNPQAERQPQQLELF
jgi:DNA repair photolyase